MKKSQSFSLALFCLLSSIHTSVVLCIKKCSLSEGGGYCPNQSKCCPLYDHAHLNNGKGGIVDGNDGYLMPVGSGCIPNDKHKDSDGECCVDNININLSTMRDSRGDSSFEGSGHLRNINTACGAGFRCANHINNVSGEKDYYCEAIDSSLNNARQPRLSLFPIEKEHIGTMYGFPIIRSRFNKDRISFSTSNTILSKRKLRQDKLIKSSKQNQSNDDSHEHILAYYSNAGPILTEDTTYNLRRNDDERSVQAVVIVIHGSGRNADDYLYSAVVSSKLQNVYAPENIVVIAPRFLAPEDGPVNISTPVKGPVIPPSYTTRESFKKQQRRQEPMRWNETDPIPHTWRYGANALPPSDDISSYDAMDAIVEYFAMPGRYPNLERIAVIGHSAGGQFTHRWALTSNLYVWNDFNDGINGDNPESQHTGLHQYNEDRFDDQSIQQGTYQQQPSIHTIVANPRSFCYLDERRFKFLNASEQYFQVPNETQVQSCKSYNQWEWGLDDGGRLPTPYKDRAIERMQGNRTQLALRYNKRRVIYLAGGNDTLPVRSSCEDDDFQGLFRRQRSYLFFESLKILFGESMSHERFVIEYVGHDHSLMFESEEGLRSMYGSNEH